MDSLTQITLGAAVGEAVAGHKVGRKAAMYGAFCGLLPDLDIALYPVLDEIQRIEVHRGLSHSFVFAMLVAPAAAYLLQRIHKKAPAGFRDWLMLVFLGIVTHPILDYLTIYGTQLFQPFSDYPAAFGSIFIIDPLYTLPLLFCLIGAWLIRGGPESKRRLVLIGLAISSTYLVWTIGAKLKAEATFERSLGEQGIRYDRIFTAPTPLNSVLWMGMAEDREGDRLLIGLHSFLDADNDITFREIPKESHLIADVLDQRPLDRLMWFSRGWYRVEPADPNTGRGITLMDLRFGRSDAYLNLEGEHIFVFELIADPPESRNFVMFRRVPPDIGGIRGENIARLWRRLQGDRSVVKNATTPPEKD